MIRIEKELISIETEHTGYYLGKRGDLIELLHYGARLRPDRELLTEHYGCGYGTDILYNEDTEKPVSLMHLNLELSPSGKGDYRQGALAWSREDTGTVFDLRFISASCKRGTKGPEGLPCALGGEETLTIQFEALSGQVHVFLIYTVYPECDVITRRMRIQNRSDVSLTLHRALSYQLDLPGTGKTAATFTGAWARERHLTRTQVSQGSFCFGSRTGISSHFCNPFFMVSDPDTTEQYGEVYGFNLIYSGSHCARIESGPFSRTRISAGIGQDGFSWTLSGKDGEGSRFDTPEAVLTWSDRGFRGCSVHMHRFVKDHIVRGKWAKKERPVVINNWEATYFKFKSHTLLRLAKEAKDLGCELFVLDDGWFGRRDTDESSLGDYTVNTKKLRGGLAGFGEELKKLGMDFGLWMEPEMISPDSDLYRAHPDWAVQVPGMEPSKGRHQLVLDLCRKDVQDYIIAQVCGILDSAPITYIKWDMNRTITDQFSRGESMSAPDGKAEQGRFFHAWTLGLYRVMNQIVRTHPDILFEGCASGGNRFDLGILCYMPQIWTSDDTDAWERMLIQTGTSYGYPQSVMSCHVSASPNHQTLRTTPLESRFDVAAMGILGYELDLAILPSAEKKVIRAQIEWYKAHRSLLQFGTFYRLASPFKEPERCIWMVVSPDRAEAVVMEGTGRLVPNSETPPVRLAGLDPDSLYKVTVRPQLIDIRTFGSLLNMVSPVKLNTSGLAVHIVSDHYRMTSETEQFLAYGDLLMHAGIRPKAGFTGCGYGEEVRMMPDYGARIWELKKKE